jgi:hypothetical protein
MLVYSETKQPVGKLPFDIPDRDFRVLRYTKPSHAKPSGELILLNNRDRSLYRAAPPVFGMQVVGE